MDPDAVLRYGAVLADAMWETMGFMLITYVPLQVAAIVMMKRLLWRIAAALPLIPMLPVIYAGLTPDAYRDGSLYGLVFYFPYAPAMVYLAILCLVRGVIHLAHENRQSLETSPEDGGNADDKTEAKR